ncbi:MAG: EamA family transporter [Bdellovibrionota bacterium]
MKHSFKLPGPVALSVLVLLVAIVSIQSGASLAKLLFPVLGAPTTAVLRLCLASVMLLAVFRPWRKRLTRKEKQSLLVYGASLGAMNFTFYLAIERIPLGIAVAIEFTGPLGLAVFASRKKIDYLWAVFALLGIILILPHSKLSDPLDPIGVLYALIAGVFWALYMVCGRRVGSSVPGGFATAWGVTIAALLTLPVGLVSAGATPLALSVLPTALLMALLSSAIPYSLEMEALKRLPTQTFSVLMSLEPAAGAIIGKILLNEDISFVQAIAIGCIMVASIGSAITASRGAAAQSA